MTIRVALHHSTHYRFDRRVKIFPHEIRLRPAPHCRTPVTGFSLRVEPAQHFINWQQDAFGNWVARLVFPEKARELSIEVDLIADMTVFNPFDFFIEDYAETMPFAYPPAMAHELGPFLGAMEVGPRLKEWLGTFRTEVMRPGLRTIDFLVALNQRAHRDVGYIVRMQPGVQTPDETLELKLGSCRDSAWLLVQALRHFGFAARFVSGYLIQLVADMKSLDGPSGTDRDFTDLHAWAEAYVPGAGWIGLDATSGLLAGEGHLPLASTASPQTAAPVIGATEVCESHLDFSMTVNRIFEDARVTKPYAEADWREIVDLGHRIDDELKAGDVRLTMGGEPTFVSIDNVDGPEWTYTALSEQKLQLAQNLLVRLAARFGAGGVLMQSQGKWYPGEPLPRWALACYFRRDRKPIWKKTSLFAETPAELDHAAGRTIAERFAAELAARLGLEPGFVLPAWEDPLLAKNAEQRLPSNLDPESADGDSSEAHQRIARLLAQQIDEPVAFVLPLAPRRRALDAKGRPRPGRAHWRSSRWPLRSGHLFLIPGDSPAGLRLPLSSLPWTDEDKREQDFPADPFSEQHELSGRISDGAGAPVAKSADAEDDADCKEILHTALCCEWRQGIMHVFLPPIVLLEDWVDLVHALESVAERLGQAIRLEGYGPPDDARLRVFRITPDPGVIEVNIHPAESWAELLANTELLYEEARQARLTTEKFMIDGRHTGTGGGNHVTLGGPTPADSPCLRRPDLLLSLIRYWQNHPALSYLFSGLFVGPTSQAPRVDEARHESLYELEIAIQQMSERLRPGQETPQAWLIDRLLRNLLVDVAGNTHRAEFCIDKLYSPDGPAGRLGLVELRAFEMPPHAQMSLVQMLLLRALVARFWNRPWSNGFVRWGTRLHDQFMLPHYVAEDMRDVVVDLQAAGYPFRLEWFAPFFEFRFPRIGTVVVGGIEVELRQAIEPWHVLGEENLGGSTARAVDSSLERLQVRVRNMTSGRHLLACNGRPVPLSPTGYPGEFVAGVRFRAWAPPSALHPTIGVHTPLVFDVVDTWTGRALGGCTYHVVHPGGRSYDTFPVNAFEAEARRRARFWDFGHTPGELHIRREGRNPDYPMTLDLRRAPEPLIEAEIPALDRDRP